MFFDSVKVPIIIGLERRSQTLTLEAENKIIKTFLGAKLESLSIERMKDKSMLPFLFNHRGKKILFDIDSEQLTFLLDIDGKCFDDYIFLDPSHSKYLF